ncbi:MAG: alpha-amylase family glycosyl hydrolase, partial [Flavisolibacter sp.]
MTNPISTYRFQFNKEFSFQLFEELIPYLQQLGVGTVYASPIFEAVPGSMHGYDGLNPHLINPEIGTEEQLYAISDKLKAAQIQWLQDIVPNHMAFDSGNNWLMDVLEKGPQSKYVSFFDITWTNSAYKGKLMVPFLGSSLEDAVSNSEIQIVYHNQGFVFKYHDAFYPIQSLSYATILQSSRQKMPEAIEMILKQLPKMEDENELNERWHEIKLQLAGLMKNDMTRNFIEDCLKEVNQFDTINKIAAEQSYRLCHWNETDNEINYRRFFTVNSLICLNIQDENVYKEYHQLVNSLMQSGVFNGLRIDHIDGLYDPVQYLKRLRNEHEDQYIVVEKILGGNESIPENWPVQGNTGYDFLAIVNNLFTNKDSERQLTRFYTQLVKDNRPVSEQIRDKKAYIAFNHMSGELDNLCTLFIELNIIEKKTFATIRREELKETIGEFLIQCPVYRFYGNEFPLENEEANTIQEILNHVRRYNRHLRRAVEILENAFLKKPYDGNEELNKKIAHFYQRCMQFT